jgi:hypothetical protein
MKFEGNPENFDWQQKIVLNHIFSAKSSQGDLLA